MRDEHGDRLGALVHVAGGFAVSGPLADSDVDVWQSHDEHQSHDGLSRDARFLPFVRAGQRSNRLFRLRGRTPGCQGRRNVAAYAAAKSGVVTLMRAVAQEERDNGVRANALAPTSIRTAANVQAMGENVRYVEREEVAARRRVSVQR